MAKMTTIAQKQKARQRAADDINPQLTVELVLLAAYRHLRDVEQWSGVKDKVEWIQRSANACQAAGTLIEVVETLDCGSIGGYGDGQPRGSSLFFRWKWLYDKYVGFVIGNRRFIDDKGLYESDIEDLNSFFERHE